MPLPPLKRIPQRDDLIISEKLLLSSLVFLCEDNPDLVRIVLEKHGRGVSCPFPFRCDRFPCEDMNCDANAITGNKVYKIDIDSKGEHNA